MDLEDIIRNLTVRDTRGLEGAMRDLGLDAGEWVLVKVDDYLAMVEAVDGEHGNHD